MVGPLTVLKMLHCRSISNQTKLKKNEKSTKSRNLYDDNMADLKLSADIKLETTNELCRVCLKQGAIAIHGGNQSEDLSVYISTFGGIEVNVFDPYPKYLCHSCNTLLQGAILFRKTAQESDEHLRKSADPEPEIDDQDLYSDTNLDVEEPSAEQLEQKSGITCKQCEIQFDTFDDYNEHRMSSDHENKKKTCPICNKSYGPQYYKIHMKIHKGGTSNICDICGKKFILPYLFNRHRLTHFYSLPFKCSLCPYRGRFSAALKMHMKSHTGEKPYICEECPQRFVSKSNLNRHMLTHKKDHDYRCECGKGFYTKRELDLHFKVEHRGIKEHVCKTCGKAFGYRKQLKKHEIKVHKREKQKAGRMPIYLKLETMKEQDHTS